MNKETEDFLESIGIKKIETKEDYLRYIGKMPYGDIRDYYQDQDDYDDCEESDCED